MGRMGWMDGWMWDPCRLATSRKKQRDRSLTNSFNSTNAPEGGLEIEESLIESNWDKVVDK